MSDFEDPKGRVKPQGAWARGRGFGEFTCGKRWASLRGLEAELLFMTLRCAALTAAGCAQSC